MSLASAVGFEALGRSAEWNYPERDGDTSQLGIIRVPTVVFTLVNELPERVQGCIDRVVAGIAESSRLGETPFTTPLSS